MTPSYRKLDSTVGIWIVMGPMLLVIGAVSSFSTPGLMVALGIAATVIGGILLLGALVGKVALLTIKALDESARERVVATNLDRQADPLR
ncbi:hypothetical protein ACWPKO_30340 (plasmid) [Coraliomargarita sp. W4R53]